MLIKNVPSNLVCLLYTFHNNRKLVADQWNFGFSNSLWINTFNQWLIFSKSALTVLRLKLERDWFKRLLTVLGWKTNEADAYYFVVLLWYFKLVVLWKQKNGKFPPCRDKLMFRKLEFRLITVSSKTNWTFLSCYENSCFKNKIYSTWNHLLDQACWHWILHVPVEGSYTISLSFTTKLRSFLKVDHPRVKYTRLTRLI